MAEIINSICQEKIINPDPCFLILTDIIDFSLLALDQQQFVIKSLWNSLDTCLTEVNKDICFFNGTGDGILVAIKQSSNYSCLDIIKLTESWIICFHNKLDSQRDILKIPTSTGIRSAIHTGGVLFLNQVIFTKTRTEMAGNTLNELSRIISLGDDGDIITSESFYSDTITISREYLEYFYPKNQPHEIFVKHNTSLSIRLFTRKDKPCTPVKIERVNYIDKEIYRILEILDNGFRALPDMRNPESLPQLDLRSSIFVPKKNHLGIIELRPTRYRFISGRENVRHGFTYYEINQGVVGKAYATGTLQICKNLPLPITAGKPNPKYIEKLITNWNLSEESILNFSRKARSFIGIPFGVNNIKPEYVICIDALQPMKSLTNKNLKIYQNWLIEDFSVSLSALLQCRIL